MRNVPERETIVQALRGLQPRLSKLGVEHLYLFGSFARGDARPGSDVDFFLDIRPDADFSLFDLVGVKYLAEDHLGRAADVTTRGGLHPMLKDEIEGGAIQVF